MRHTGGMCGSTKAATMPPVDMWPITAAASYQRRVIRNKAQYSLDCDDGIEYSACLSEPTPQELLERMERFCDLWNALNTLPETQGLRIDACIIEGKSMTEVAEAEGVSVAAVHKSIQQGLKSMKKYLQNV